MVLMGPWPPLLLRSVGGSCSPIDMSGGGARNGRVFRICVPASSLRRSLPPAALRAAGLLDDDMESGPRDGARQRGVEEVSANFRVCHICTHRGAQCHVFRGALPTLK